MTGCQGIWRWGGEVQDGPDTVRELLCSGCADVWIIIFTPGRRERSGTGSTREAAMRAALVDGR